MNLSHTQKTSRQVILDFVPGGPQQIVGCLLIFLVETKRLIIVIFSLITFFFSEKTFNMDNFC
jgi:hypothetical protein